MRRPKLSRTASPCVIGGTTRIPQVQAPPSTTWLLPIKDVRFVNRVGHPITLEQGAVSNPVPSAAILRFSACDVERLRSVASTKSASDSQRLRP